MVCGPKMRLGVLRDMAVPLAECNMENWNFNQRTQSGWVRHEREIHICNVIFNNTLFVVQCDLFLNSGGSCGFCHASKHMHAFLSLRLNVDKNYWKSGRHFFDRQSWHEIDYKFMPLTCAKYQTQQPMHDWSRHRTPTILNFTINDCDWNADSR